MTVKFSTWIDSLVPVATTLSATDKIAVVTDAPDSRAITRDNLARSVYETVMTTDGDLITRSGGEPTRVTRSGLANDAAFTDKYTQLTTLTTDGDLYTRAGGVVTRITRASLADDTAFTSKYLTSAATVLGDLTDVDLAGLSDGDYIRYDSATGDWLPEAPLVTAAQFTTLETAVGLLTNLSLNNKTANYTLVLGDATKTIEMNVASANTLTIPTNASVAFPVGTQIIVIQTGAGQTTLVAGAGVTVNSKDGFLKLRGQWAGVTLIKRATDTWVAVGDLA
jgi:hypothetical protein